MLAALRSRALASRSGHPLLHHQGPWRLLESLRPVSSSPYTRKPSLLELEEIEKILDDVKADDVRVIPVGNQCDWTDFMVVATGRSTWHVRNIAQALIHKAGLVFLLAYFKLSHGYLHLLIWSGVESILKLIIDCWNEFEEQVSKAFVMLKSVCFRR